MKQQYIVVLISLIISACSSGEKALNRGDYFQAINQAVERLESDPDNRKASGVLEEGYPMAMQYYQEQIDLSLSGNAPFKWVETVRVMEKVNALSERIRRIPSARKLIPNPKVYISEIRPAQEKAAAELYEAGLQHIEKPAKEDARQAYDFFLQADKMIPGYREVNRLLRESKERATWHVIVEQVPVFSERYALAADFFYDRVMGFLKYQFPSKGFVNFYSVNEAGNQHIEYPDMVVRMGFYDFNIGLNQHTETQEPLSRSVEERVKVNIKKDSVAYETRIRQYKGTIKIIKDQVVSQGILSLEINDFKAERTILKDRIPGQFIWNNAYGVFVGDQQVLEPRHNAILKNQAYPPPAPQDMFIEVTKPIYDQLNGKLSSFFRKVEAGNWEKRGM